MARSLDAYDGISIASLIVYVPLLAGAIFICLKHGFSRCSGWFFLNVLVLARLIGSCLHLATISQPEKEGLYTGWMILNGFGLGPLVLLLLALLSRVFESINRQGHVFVKPLCNQVIQALMFAAILLVVIGGTQSDFSFENGAMQVKYSSASRAGTAIMAAVVGLVGLEWLLALQKQGYVYQGEHRIILAVGFSLPFVIVRVVYSCLLVFGHQRPNAWMYLGMLVIPELVVAVALEALGFMLDRAPPTTVKEPGHSEEEHGIAFEERNDAKR
ncbi:hypothetical protein CDD81_1661 [Ophiocordyceps australis]|uniref:DUF7702 domain-containing protein n=1 Tax=Ophiocordyceps australis TaxID=1399860 RepID=A0A2C5X7Z6_9HYPO|nr:hypothetical protein CDD81_1661 [Ophiocordyceps australis]